MAKQSVLGLCKDIEYIKKEVNEINAKLDLHYVTKEEFEPVKKLVYGMVSLILIAVVGALLGLIILK